MPTMFAAGRRCRTAYLVHTKPLTLGAMHVCDTFGRLHHGDAVGCRSLETARSWRPSCSSRGDLPRSCERRQNCTPNQWHVPESAMCLSNHAHLGGLAVPMSGAYVGDAVDLCRHHGPRGSRTGRDCNSANQTRRRRVVCFSLINNMGVEQLERLEQANECQSSLLARHAKHKIIRPSRTLHLAQHGRTPSSARTAR